MTDQEKLEDQEAMDATCQGWLKADRLHCEMMIDIYKSIPGWVDQQKSNNGDTKGVNG